MEEDKFSPEETQLAEKLRLLCTQWGKERENEITKSAAILLEMGRLYLKRALKSSGMEQKTAFFKSAALIAASRARFQRTKPHDSKISEACTVFVDMCNSLLKASKARKQNGLTLLQKSDSITATLKWHRDNQKKKVDINLQPLGEELSEADLIHEQTQKIQFIKERLKENTEIYSEIMKDISKTTAEILGLPLCKFSLVGLGSFARGEVTLYSDFEHIIILEEGVQNRKNYYEMKEYFRWYSVIFQIVVIGLGETILPSIGVESLNDIYSTDKSKNWFFDSFTPSGVSFDGRFPHACKTPLGKQEPSKKRTHVVELIQPVSEMAAFLTTEEDLKNGYHLRDVLMSTSLVAGEEAIFEDYKKRMLQILSKQSIETLRYDQLKFFAESEDFVMNKPHELLQEYDVANIKDFFYRPVATLVHGLSILFGELSGASSFQFFSWFRNSKYAGKETEEYLHNLEYSLAVACEIRLKMYALFDRQTGRAQTKAICKIIGKTCRLRICRTIVYTWKLMTRIWKKKEDSEEFCSNFKSLGEYITTSNTVKNDVMILRFSGFMADAYETEGCIYLEDPEERKQASNSILHLMISPRLGRPVVDAKVIEEITRKNKETLNMDDVEMLSSYYFDSGRIQDAISLIDDWRPNSANSFPSFTEDFMELHVQKWISMLNHLAPEEFLESIGKELTKFNDSRYKIFLLMASCNAHLVLKHWVEAKQSLHEASEIYKKKSKEMLYNNTVLVYGFAQLLIGIHDCVNQELVDLLINVKHHMEFVSQSSSSSIELTKMTDCDENIDISTVLQVRQCCAKMVPTLWWTYYPALLSLMENALNFSRIMWFFEQVPKDELQKALQVSFGRKFTLEGLSYKICKNFSSVLHYFRTDLTHPQFVGNILSTNRNVVRRRNRLFLDLDATVHTYNNIASKVYKQAVIDIMNLDIEYGVKLLWWIVNSDHSDYFSKLNASNLLVSAPTLVLFRSIIHSLVELRPAWIARNSMESFNHVTSKHNEAAARFIQGDIRQSSILFWRNIFASNRSPLMRKRSTCMLAHVIILKWQLDGCTLFVKGGYVGLEAFDQDPIADMPDYHPILALNATEASTEFMKLETCSLLREGRNDVIEKMLKSAEASNELQWLAENVFKPIMQ